MAHLTYKVRVGDDGRWHYVGDVWIEAAKTAVALRDRAGRAEIFAYSGNSRIGRRVYAYDADGKPSLYQEGEMR